MVCFLNFEETLAAFGFGLDSKKGVEESLTLVVVQMGVHFRTS
jgi:hypothetical protein